MTRWHHYLHCWCLHCWDGWCSYSTVDHVHTDMKDCQLFGLGFGVEKRSKVHSVQHPRIKIQRGGWSVFIWWVFHQTICFHWCGRVGQCSECMSDMMCLTVWLTGEYRSRPWVPWRPCPDKNIVCLASTAWVNSICHDMWGPVCPLTCNGSGTVQSAYHVSVAQGQGCGACLSDWHFLENSNRKVRFFSLE